MDKETALHFLRHHQPMPDDVAMNDNPTLIYSYNEALRYFTDHPDLEAVPLLLNSFGDGSGFGMCDVPLG